MCIIRSCGIQKRSGFFREFIWYEKENGAQRKKKHSVVCVVMAVGQVIEKNVY